MYGGGGGLEDMHIVGMLVCMLCVVSVLEEERITLIYINLYLFCFINPLLVLIVSGHTVSLTAENMKYDEKFSIMIFNISKMCKGLWSSLLVQNSNNTGAKISAEHQDRTSCAQKIQNLLCNL